MLQFPKMWPTDPKKSAELGQSIFVREKTCVNIKTNTNKMNTVIDFIAASVIWKLKILIPTCWRSWVFAKRECPFSYINKFFEWFLELYETTVHKWHSFHQEWMFFFYWAFPMLLWKKWSLEHNGVCKNVCASACRCWIERLFRRDVDQKDILGGTIVIETLDFDFCYSTNFRLYAKLYDSAQKMWWNTGKGCGHSPMIGRGPNSCWLGYVTGLLLYLYVKHLLLSFLTSVNFWSIIFSFCTGWWFCS